MILGQIKSPNFICTCITWTWNPPFLLSMERNRSEENNLPAECCSFLFFFLLDGSTSSAFMFSYFLLLAAHSLPHTLKKDLSWKEPWFSSLVVGLLWDACKVTHKDKEILRYHNIIMSSSLETWARFANSLWSAHPVLACFIATFFKM